MLHQLFFGREEEQNRFRALLKDINNRSKRDEGLPTVILLYGQGGIGKTALDKQFRQIADDEFMGKFQTFFLGWEEELERDSRLQVGHNNIEEEAVFNALYKAIIREQPAWGKHLKEYEKFVKRYQHVQEVITNTVNQHEELRDLGGLGANVLAKLIAMSIPIPQPLGEPLETTISVGLRPTLEAGGEQLTKLRKRLQERLNGKQYELLLRPNEQMSRALGQGLAQVAKERPFTLFLDTYELVDRVDFWIRDAIKVAGSGLVWVISGRRNLWKSGLWGTKRFKGYDEADGENFHVIRYDMQKLAAKDIKNYFATAVPKRPLTPDQLKSIQQATLGIPLAVRTAADIYKETGKLKSVVGRGGQVAPGKDIVQAMMGRLLYVIGQIEDGRQRQKEEEALCALALANGNVTLLREMLTLEDGQDYDLEEFLNPIENKYASVFRDKMKLHDEPYIFFRNHLRLKREEKWVQRINERAISVLQADLEEKVQLGLISLEARCDDEDWVKIVLKLTDHFFWLDERKGWRWLMPRFIESLVHNRSLRDGLLEVVVDWQPILSSVGKKRLELMRAVQRLLFPLVSRYTSRLQEEEDLLDDLQPLVEELKWLDGDNEGERWAIWYILRGELAFREAVYRHESCEEAAELLTQALSRLPKYGRKLRERLAQDFNVLGNYSGRPSEGVIYFEKAVQCNPKYVPALIGLGQQCSYLGRSDKATEVYQRAIDLLTEVEIVLEDASARRNLATAYNNLAEEQYNSEQYEQSLALFQKAKDLNPQDDIIHANMGDVLANLGHIEKAVEAYKTAIELNPAHIRCYLVLAVMYRLQGLEQQFAEQLEQARQAATPEWLSNDWDPLNRACFAAVVDNNMEKVLELLEQSFKLYPGLRSRALHEPAFLFIQHDLRFRDLVNV